MLRYLWNLLFGLDWNIGLGDCPPRDVESDWDCGPQGAGYLPMENETPEQ